jgi:hypothetical protein
MAAIGPEAAAGIFQSVRSTSEWGRNPQFLRTSDKGHLRFRQHAFKLRQMAVDRGRRGDFWFEEVELSRFRRLIASWRTTCSAYESPLSNLRRGLLQEPVSLGAEKLNGGIFPQTIPPLRPFRMALMSGLKPVQSGTAKDDCRLEEGLELDSPVGRTLRSHLQEEPRSGFGAPRLVRHLHLCGLTQCIPHDLRDKLDGTGYSGHEALLKMACLRAQSGSRAGSWTKFRLFERHDPQRTA